MHAGMAEAVGKNPLTSDEVDLCVSQLSEWPGAADPTPIAAVIATFATALPPEWLLGASAVLRGVPLVVIGLGMPWGGMKNAVIRKFYAVRRAAQVHAVKSEYPPD